MCEDGVSVEIDFINTGSEAESATLQSDCGDSNRKAETFQKHYDARMMCNDGVGRWW